MDSVRRKIPPVQKRFREAPATVSIPRAPIETRVFSAPPINTPSLRKKPRAYPRRHRFPWRILIIAGITLSLLGLTLFGYFSWKVGDVSRSMSITPHDITPVSDTIRGATTLLTPIFHLEQSPLPGESQGRTNILLLGKANEKTAGQKLTDTIMVASFDFTRKKIALLSLPRDLYVEIPDTHTFTKLNALYQYDMDQEKNAETVKKAVSNITGLPIHAFATLDYDGFVRIVDQVGGISVFVERDLFDPHYPGPNYSYETFQIDAGWRDLDGATALKYVRERHADPEGDFGRAKRQQAVLSAIKNKAFSTTTFLDPRTIFGIMETLGSHIRTDLSLENISSLLALANTFDTHAIETVVVDAWKPESLLRVSHVQVGPVAMFILLPRTGNWNEIRELANTIFDRSVLLARRQAVAEEHARVALINTSDAATLGTRVRHLLTQEIDMQSVRLVPPKEAETLPRKQSESLLVRRNSTEAVHTTDEIARRFSLPPSKQDSAFFTDTFSDFDVLLFLGNDLAKRLSFEEDTIEDIQSAESDPDYHRRLESALEEHTKR